MASDDHLFKVKVRHQLAEIIGEVLDGHARTRRRQTATSVPTVVPVNDQAILGEVRLKVSPDEALASDPVAKHDRGFDVIAARTSRSAEPVKEACSVFRLHKTLAIVLQPRALQFHVRQPRREHARRSHEVQRDKATDIGRSGGIKPLVVSGAWCPARLRLFGVVY